MGTSSSGGGARGRTPLLPNWAPAPPPPPPPPDDENDPKDDKPSKENDSPAAPSTTSGKANQTDDWTSARRSFGRFVNSNSPGLKIREAARAYVRSTGGHAKATKSAAMGIAVGGAFLEFLSTIKKGGVNQAVEEYSLNDCIGKPLDEVLARISNKIVPIGTTNDESIARNAMMQALDVLYNKLGETELGLESLHNASEDALKESVTEYLSSYIFKKWVYELGVALEKNELTIQQAVDLEKSVKHLIRDEVRSCLKKHNILTLDFTKGQGKTIVENIFVLAYSTLEK